MSGPSDAVDLSAPVTGTGASVVGLQWGDEGKGKLIDVLAPGFDAVVRYNGGANAGHSVVFGGERYALHLIPSGIFHPGVRAVVANGVVVDPFALVGEIDGLVERGVDVTGLLLSDRAHLVMPYHREEDALRERALAGDAGDRSIGTTKRGIGPAYADKMHRSGAVRVGDLLRPETLAARLDEACRVKGAALRALDPGADAPDARELLESLRPVAERLRPFITDTAYLLHGMLRDGRRLLFEGANATLLDVDHGTFPYVTSSSTTSLGIAPGTGLPGRHVGEVVGVMKAYSTRVGAGPFPTELEDADGDRLRERGREYGTTTGRPRRCGWLDLVAVRYSAMVNGATSLAVMLFDVLAGFESLRVCTGYRIDGELTGRFPPDAADLARAEPAYETLPGFAQDVTGVRRREDLPDAARRYLDRVESFVGVPVSHVSVGPDREQTIGAPAG